MQRIVVLACFGFLVAAALAADRSRIPWMTDYSAAKTASQKSGALLLVHFYFDECPPCREMERTTFTDSRVVRALRDRRIVVVKVDVRSDAGALVAQAARVTQCPADVVYDSDGTRLAFRVGATNAADYVDLVKSALRAPGS